MSRQCVSESDTIERSIVLRIKRNIVTRINSKRWRYWASVQGYSPSVLALSGTFCSVFPSPTFPSPIFSLSVSHILTVLVFLPCLVFKAIFRFTILLPLLSFYDPLLLFLLLLSLLDEREDSANFPYFFLHKFAWLFVVTVEIIVNPCPRFRSWRMRSKISKINRDIFHHRVWRELLYTFAWNLFWRRRQRGVKVTFTFSSSESFCFEHLRSYVQFAYNSYSIYEIPNLLLRAYRELESSRERKN